ncbi:7411_t:CDS:2, partial [Scutellospora calospora]
MENNIIIHIVDFLKDYAFSKFSKEHGHSDEDIEEFQKIADKTHKHLTSTGEHEADIDHEAMRNKHKKIYESEDDEDESEHSNEDLGHAAAFEAMKKMGGGDGDGGSFDKSALLSLAMSEGMKLWQSRKSSSGGGGKEEILQGACSMAMKLMNKGGDEGGGSGLA